MKYRIMTKKEINRLIKDNKDNLQKLIYKHINCDINLTTRQINEVIKLRDNMKVKGNK